MRLSWIEYFSLSQQLWWFAPHWPYCLRNLHTMNQTYSQTQQTQVYPEDLSNCWPQQVSHLAYEQSCSLLFTILWPFLSFTMLFIMSFIIQNCDLFKQSWTTKGHNLALWMILWASLMTLWMTKCHSHYISKAGHRATLLKIHDGKESWSFP